MIPILVSLSISAIFYMIHHEFGTSKLYLTIFAAVCRIHPGYTLRSSTVMLVECKAFASKKRSQGTWLGGSARFVVLPRISQAALMGSMLSNDRLMLI